MAHVLNTNESTGGVCFAWKNGLCCSKNTKKKYLSQKNRLNNFLDHKATARYKYLSEIITQQKNKIGENGTEISVF